MEACENNLALPMLEQQCTEAVENLLARHDWQLLDHAEFIRRTVAHVRFGVVTNLVRAATYTYSLTLYHACSGAEGAERQNRGYIELFHYLYNCARRRNPQIAEDATQRALEAIFRRFTCCRRPGAFLAFAVQHLIDAAKALRRHEDRWLTSQATLVGTGDEILGELLPDPQPVEPAAAVLAAEMGTRLRVCATHFLRKHPRAVQQFAALWLKYIDGLDDLTIGRKLGKPVRSVYVLRSRAIAKLQADMDWRNLAQEWGLRPTTLEEPAVASVGD